MFLCRWLVVYDPPLGALRLPQGRHWRTGKARSAVPWSETVRRYAPCLLVGHVPLSVVGARVYARRHHKAIDALRKTIQMDRAIWPPQALRASPRGSTGGPAKPDPLCSGGPAWRFAPCRVWPVWFSWRSLGHAHDNGSACHPAERNPTQATVALQGTADPAPPVRQCRPHGGVARSAAGGGVTLVSAGRAKSAAGGRSLAWRRRRCRSSSSSARLRSR